MSGNAASNVLAAAQQFGGEKSELKKIKLFAPVNDTILYELIRKYLSDKKMLKSELIIQKWFFTVDIGEYLYFLMSDDQDI